MNIINQARDILHHLRNVAEGSKAVPARTINKESESQTGVGAISEFFLDESKHVTLKVDRSAMLYRRNLAATEDFNFKTTLLLNSNATTRTQQEQAATQRGEVLSDPYGTALAGGFWRLAMFSMNGGAAVTSMDFFRGGEVRTSRDPHRIDIGGLTTHSHGIAPSHSLDQSLGPIAASSPKEIAQFLTWELSAGCPSTGG